MSSQAVIAKLRHAHVAFATIAQAFRRCWHARRRKCRHAEASQPRGAGTVPASNGPAVINCQDEGGDPPLHRISSSDFLHRIEVSHAQS